MTDEIGMQANDRLFAGQANDRLSRLDDAALDGLLAKLGEHQWFAVYGSYRPGLRARAITALRQLRVERDEARGMLADIVRVVKAAEAVLRRAP